ncbi:Hypothetical protein NGAL_HAMBI2610_41940 [Neorhizobium galegae bv. orientalis]|nr:Hypothetical protein NGAL_HAMBI2610_41940 [Neorhizobium galegae bv. orientalis]
MPKYQGELDGLCGVYAIINAYETCGLLDDGELHEEMFKACCNGLKPAAWPEVLWSGTEYRDLQRMIKSCKKLVPSTSEVKVSMPFQRQPPKSDKEYWTRFDEVLLEDDGETKCAIIGVTRPSNHWIVAARDGNRIWFADSTANQTLMRKNRKSLFAGERNGNPNVWLIDRSELIVFAAMG